MFKTIMVHVDGDDPTSADRIEVAAGIAAWAGATLIGLAARPSDATIAMIASGGALISGSVVEDLERDLQATFDRDRTEFDRLTRAKSVTTTWRSIEDFPTSALARTAAAADLIVIGTQLRKPVEGGAYVSVVIGDLTLEAGRPVLGVPPGAGKRELSSGLIAWRNTTESRRAVRDALPLLQAAASVDLVHVREQPDETGSIADAEAFLAGHGIRCRSQVLDSGPKAAGEAITDFAHETAARFIVAGAYGHSRLGEWLLGGTSRTLTHQIDLPVLLSH